MRSIALKAALAAMMIITVPLSGAFAAGGHGGGGRNGGAGDEGGHGSGAYEDFSQKRWFDGINSDHHQQTPLGAGARRQPLSSSIGRCQRWSQPLPPLCRGRAATDGIGISTAKPGSPT